MPEKYEHIRDSLEASGHSEKEAERIAAATYNKERKPGQAPVTGNSEKAEPLVVNYGPQLKVKVTPVPL